MTTTELRIAPEPLAGPVAAPTSPLSLTEQVSTAVNLGWIVDKLWRLAWGEDRDLDDSEDLPGVDVERRVAVYCHQAASAMGRLGIHVDCEKDSAANLNALPPCVTTPGQEAVDTVHGLHVALLTALTEEHYKLGKGYLLGCGLASLYRPGRGWIRLGGQGREISNDRFDASTVSVLLDTLAGLECVLPHNAVATVALSLQRTMDSNAADGKASAQPRLDPDELRLQGHRWRALLTGEAEVGDVMETADYLGAAKTLLDDCGQLAWHAVKLFRVPLAVVMLLGFAGAALSVVGPFNTWAGGGVIGAVVSVGAAFLAAVRIISPSLMRVAEKAAPRLWDEAVVTAVAAALPERSVLAVRPEHDR